MGLGEASRPRRASIFSILARVSAISTSFSLRIAVFGVTMVMACSAVRYASIIWAFVTCCSYLLDIHYGRSRSQQSRPEPLSSSRYSMKNFRSPCGWTLYLNVLRSRSAQPAFCGLLHHFKNPWYDPMNRTFRG